MPQYLRQNNQLVKGDELWLFLGTASGNEKPTCFATQHSLSRSLSTTSVSSKDHGNTSYVIPGEGSWTCSTEALMSIKTGDSGAMAFESVMDAYDSGSKVYVKFGKLSNYVASGIVDVDNATPWQLATPYWKGEGYITSLQASGGHGDSATFSIEITGIGPLTKISVAPTPHTITLTGNASSNFTLSTQSAVVGTKVKITPINPIDLYINMYTTSASSSDTGIQITKTNNQYMFIMVDNNVEVEIDVVKYTAELSGALAAEYTLSGDTNGYYTIGSYVLVTSDDPSKLTSSYMMTSDPTAVWSLNGSYFQATMPNILDIEHNYVYLLITPQYS